MKQTHLFTKTRKEAPADEVAKNAQLLIRAGYINKEMAGVYDMLPLGLRVLRKIESIIREEMEAIGGQEILMSALQRKELWEKTGRWDDSEVDVWFKTNLKEGGDRGSEIGLAPTHEEPITQMMEQFVPSYRDVPKLVYQFQTKFRNELRSKSGVLRTREFIMKDLYSFARSKKEHDTIYEQVKEAYKKIFQRVGLGDVTKLTFASGGMFAKFSHEFQTLSEAGEDTIHVDEEKDIAINEEVFNSEVQESLGISPNSTKEYTAIETGNIFSLGTKFSEPLMCKFTDETGEQVPVYMGSYGIGLGRLMGTVVEVLSDKDGLVWPESIAPFQVHIISLDQDEKSESLYEECKKHGIEVLYDDRADKGAGEKLRDADLIGIPYRIVVSERSQKEGGYEVKKRNEQEAQIVSEGTILEYLKGSVK